MESFSFQEQQQLLDALKSPPLCSFVRICSIRWTDGIESAIQYLDEFMAEQCKAKGWKPFITHRFNALPDVLFVMGERSRSCVEQVGPRIIVDVHCGMAVMRGADIYTVGILGGDWTKDQRVAIYVDVSGKCTRAAKIYTECKLQFIGNGKALVSRQEVFSVSQKQLRGSGVGVVMVDPLFLLPALGSLFDKGFVLQNLPSILAGHALDVKPQHRILDMCCCPGGKTTHLASLTGDKASIIALDHSKPKITRLVSLLDRCNFKNIRAFVCNSADAVLSTQQSAQFDFANDLPSQGNLLVDGLPRCSFDRILLDPPCSGLGQRPWFEFTIDENNPSHFPRLTRSMLHAAYKLLKPGGRLVFSTCTFHVKENEKVVHEFLHTFPDMHLVGFDPLVDRIDWKQASQPGRSFNADEPLDPAIANSVCRFDPHMPVAVINGPEQLRLDSIGFFFSVFTKSVREQQNR